MIDVRSVMALALVKHVKEQKSVTYAKVLVLNAGDDFLKPK